MFVHVSYLCIHLVLFSLQFNTNTNINNTTMWSGTGDVPEGWGQVIDPEGKCPLYSACGPFPPAMGKTCVLGNTKRGTACKR
jgi:hypothetical protein